MSVSRWNNLLSAEQRNETSGQQLSLELEPRTLLDLHKTVDDEFSTESETRRFKVTCRPAETMHSLLRPELVSLSIPSGPVTVTHVSQFNTSYHVVS